MVRKRINHQNEYAVTRIGYCVGGDVEKARVMAHSFYFLSPSDP